MALIKCNNCGSEISDKAKECPHCKEPIVKEFKPNELICEECGSTIEAEADVCPKCGCPVSDVKKIQNMAQNVAYATGNKVKNMDGNTKKYIAVVFCAIILIIGIFFVKNNVLIGDDKIAYDLIIEAAENFKNPSSLRLVSGTLGVDKDCMWCGISATNGFGARSTGYYFVMNGWILEEEEDIDYMYTEKEDLNIALINKKLEKALADAY